MAAHFYSFSIFRRLTVRKEGPNTGRPFYVCPKQPQCEGNFFQWADVPSGNTGSNTSFVPSSTSASSSGTSQSNYNNRPSTSRGSLSSSAANNTDGPPRAKRKCGICKEEGHTRQKCPRGPNAHNL